MKSLIIYIFVFSSSAWSSPCGKEGTVDERIKNCNSAKGEFALVLRDEKGLEIYKDLKTGLIWADRISTDFNHYGSQKACSDAFPEKELLKDVHWRLPTVREFEIASSHGMKESLPHMFHTFWTSTPVKSGSKSRRRRRAQPSQAFLWDGMEQKSDTGDLKDAASVRCVGQ
jgi:hypothetical protein